VVAVFRRFAPGYQAAHGAAMPPSHRRAIADILACRTEALGGHLERCTACGAEVHRCHSCRNRSCPKCHGEQTRAWLDKRQAEMLACPYFHVTVTVPEELRAALRRHQRDGYGALMAAAGEAIVGLARDPRHVGGTVGVLAVLHTWTQQLHFHPHVHCLVTGGGLGGDGETWHPARPGFLVPTKALARKVRGRFRAVFQRRCPGVSLPAAVWRTPWVVHITPWGVGEPAVLDYLARYVFRIALTDRRIVDLDGETVSFQYRDRKGPGPAGSRGPSSCAAISSMFCPRAFTRSATSACGIRPGAARRSACATPCGSTAPPDRRPVPNHRVPPIPSPRPGLVRGHHRHRPVVRAPGAGPASSSSSPDGPRCAQGLHSSRCCLDPARNRRRRVHHRAPPRIDATPLPRLRLITMPGSA
jgi:hypothetical protein